MKEVVADYSLRIRLLGKFQVSVDGELIEETRWQRRSAKLLIKLLALRPEHQLHREQAMELLWPESPPQAAANNLNKVIHMARRALEPDLSTGGNSRFLHRESDLIVLRAPGNLWVDVQAFENQAVEASEIDTIEGYQAALAHYTGDLLDEDLYEDWLSNKRDKLRLLYQELTLKLAQAHENEGRFNESIERLGELLDAEPTNEDAHRHLMRLYMITGHRQQALLQYRRCREIVRRELAVEPEASTCRLHEEIVSGQFHTLQGKEIPRVGDASDFDSLAILPFGNGSGDPNLEYLCEGITESLINSLAQLPGLRVMARSTVFRYKDCEIDTQAVGRKLAVQAVVLGRVVQRSSTLTIGAELVDVTDGSLIWGDQYNRALTDIFAVQEEISRKISEKLRLKLTGSDNERLHKRHTESTQAYGFYLKGRFHWNKRTGADLQTALGYFQAAIEEDPAYALAYTGLADCYNLLSLYSVVPPTEAMPKAKAAVARALEIDDTLAEAHTSLAHCRLSYDWDWNGAESAFQRAMEINPNYATAHHWYHKYLTAMGRFEERVVQINKAIELDPLSLIINTEAGWGLYYSRQYDQAIQLLTKTLEMDSRFAIAHLILGLVFQQKQRLEEAIVEVQQAIALQEGSPFSLAVGVLGHAYATSGNAQLAREQLTNLAELGHQYYVSAYSFALVHVGLGEHDRAVECLQSAYEERYDRMIFLNVEPMFDPLRHHPGFCQLTRRLSLG